MVEKRGGQLHVRDICDPHVIAPLLHPSPRQKFELVAHPLMINALSGAPQSNSVLPPLPHHRQRKRYCKQCATCARVDNATFEDKHFLIEG